MMYPMYIMKPVSAPASGAGSAGTSDDALTAEPAGFVTAIELLVGFAEPAALCITVEPEAALGRPAAALVLATRRSPSRVGRARKSEAPLACHVFAETARASRPPRLPSAGLCCLLRRWRRRLLPRLLTRPPPRAVCDVLAAANTPGVDFGHAQQLHQFVLRHERHLISDNLLSLHNVDRVRRDLIALQPLEGLGQVELPQRLLVDV